MKKKTEYLRLSNEQKLRLIFEISVKKILLILITLNRIPELYSTDTCECYRQGKCTKEYYMDIKKSRRRLIYKVNNCPMNLQKICERNFNCHWTYRLVNTNIRKKQVKNEVLKLQAFLASLCLLFFIFSPNDSHSKTMKKCFLFHLKSSFSSQNIQLLQFFPSFPDVSDSKGQTKVESLCYEFACIK